MPFFCTATDQPLLEFVYRAPDLRVLIMPWMGYDKPIDWSKVSRHLEELYLYRRTISAAELEAIRSFQRLRVLQLIDCVADSKLGRGLPLNAPRPAENWKSLERWAGWLPEEANCELVLRIAPTSAR